MSREQDGFSLIEALVALAVLALSATALVGATEAYVARVRGLEDRAVAQWIAENTLAELQFDDVARSTQAQEVVMMNRSWTAAIDYTPTSDPDLWRVTIAVGESGGSPLVRFGGFIDRDAKSP